MEWYRSGFEWTEQEAMDYLKHQRNNRNKNQNKVKMKTSKITDIKGAGTYESKFGLLYKFEYSFEDGQLLTANHKTENSPFNIGDEAQYTVKGSNDYGSWGSVSRPEDQQGTSFKGGGAKTFKADPLKQASIEKQVALKEAINFHNVAGFQAEDNDMRKAEIVLTAKYLFEEFLKG